MLELEKVLTTELLLRWKLIGFLKIGPSILSRIWSTEQFCPFSSSSFLFISITRSADRYLGQMVG